MRTLHPSSPEPPTDGYTPSRTEGLSLPGVLFDPSVEPAEKDEVDRDGDKKQGSENEVSVGCTYRHTPVEPLDAKKKYIDTASSIIGISHITPIMTPPPSPKRTATIRA